MITSIKNWLLVWVWIIGFYVLTQLATAFFFDLSVWKGVWAKDAFAHIILGSILFVLCRGFWPWAIAYSLLVAVFQVSNALKFVVLGSPIMPDDFVDFSNMFLLFDDWRLWAMWAALLIPVLMWVYAIAWRKPLTWFVLLLLLISGASFARFSPQVNHYMDEQFGDRIWDQPGNYRDRGLPLHVLHETSRNLARGRVVLTPEQVVEAKTTLISDALIAQRPAGLDKRNIYIILLESFWDPMTLKTAEISDDPFDPRFRALWKSSGHSTALAPVFGGYTANSEFEILCGFPVLNDAVFFEGWLRNEATCLPGYLANAGYRTIASHPNFAAFWNRVNAYDRIGFTDYWSVNDFELDDLNGVFLSDESLFRQLWKKQAEMRQSEKPLLSYIVTYFGHLDYPLNEQRPKKVSVKNDTNMVERYVNLLYYKTRELMNFYELIREEDPNAVIVMFGDHLPFLGPKYAGFVESGLLKSSKGEFTAEMFRTYSETPLIVVDGQNGVLEQHRLPMFRLPALITELLGDTNTSLLNVTKLPQGQTLRPLPGITLVQPSSSLKAKPFTCVAGNFNDPCKDVNQWVEKVKVLTADIFTGDQLVLQE